MRIINKKIFLVIVCLAVLGPFILLAQEIITPQAYFDQVSAKFGAIADYSAHIRIENGGNVMEGTVIYKAPNRLRIDFSTPASQVLVTDGSQLLIYVPQYYSVLEQKLKPGSIQSIGSTQSYYYLKKHYSVGYLIGQDPVVLDAEKGLKEKVIKLKFFSSTAAYRELRISFNAEGFMRRVEASRYGQTLLIDFTNIRANIGIPDASFKYTPPPGANVYSDFLYEVLE